MLKAKNKLGPRLAIFQPSKIEESVIHFIGALIGELGWFFSG
jgi:hypothetical protein